jgi:GntR family transcriptional regulator
MRKNAPRNTMQIPKYVMLESVLRETLHRMAPGDKLPPEGTLARQFGVSRVTLQRALAPLVEDGIISRQQGKGTFFVGLDETKALQKLSGALDSLMIYEGGARARVLDKSRRGQAPPRIREQIGLAPEAELVIIKRIVVSDGEPLIYLINYLPEELGEKVFDDDREMERFPIISLLRDKYNVPLVRATQTIEAVLADPVLAKHLVVPVGAALLLVERIYYTADGRTAQFTQSWYRSDRYKYSVTLRDWRGPRWQPRKHRSSDSRTNQRGKTRRG